ncbi:MAG TPA: TRAP transporter fused permease subunit [Myxococcaceae bacterium]|nr:TRAP transporter fused permease subunit [Myxococcaceae bacterium]
MARHELIQLNTWFSVGCRRHPEGWLSWAVVTPLAAGITLYVLLAATYFILDPWALGALFLMSMMALAFLVCGATPHSDPKRPSVLDWILFALAVATGVYFGLTTEQVVNRISLFFPLDGWQTFFGSVAFLLTLEITRRTTGLGLTAVVLLFVAYNLFGHRLGGVLGHGDIDYSHFLDITVYTTDGIMGLPVQVAATYAFLFVLFGTFLHYARGADFFFEIAAVISGRQVGGPAKVAVVSSAFYGMISGSPTSDVVTTGTITIPIMKRIGYPAAVAGAIEVAASTGGSIMPPVMGSAAFIMAEYTGIDYSVIATAALLPALLFYLGVYAQVHFRAVRCGFAGLDPARVPKLLPTLKNGGMFVVPLVVLVWALMQGYTPTTVAAFGVFAVIAVAAIRKETRIGLVAAYKACAETAIRMVPVAGATAAAGLVIAGITMTGLAAKFGHIVYALTDARLLPTLLLGAGLTIVLGMGMPTPSAYILAAVLIGPLFTQLQIDPLAAHLFLLYYAVLSALTPPVAVAAYAASSIAEDNPLSIAAHAVKLALAAFVVPFTFVYGPELLWQGSLWETALTFFTAAAGLILIAAAIERYTPLSDSGWARVLMGVAGLLLITPFHVSTTAGLVLAVAVGAANRLAVRSKVAAYPTRSSGLH